MPDYKYDTYKASNEHLSEVVTKYATKFVYWAQHGYRPHVWQTLFHTNTYQDKLTRFRHLVAGRRGGKTLSAAYEVVFYAMYPEQFWIDAHNAEGKKDPLWIWVLGKDHKVARPSLITILQVLRNLGLQRDVDFRYNKTEKLFEFIQSESIIEFRSADDPENLRGAGLDILWIDEAALLTDETAWNVVRPSLSDKLGLVITTTTPQGKNWFYDEFWGPEAMADLNNGRVEYRSIDNPYFRKEEWEYIRRRYHPLMFLQEYMASFDSMAGRDLSGEWLKYYTLKDLPKLNEKDYDLRLYMGVDPAVSLADTADRFSMALVGVDAHYNAYLLEQYAGRIPFPEQVEKIAEWHIKYRPQMIGVESTAYQAALVQQTARLETLPPIVPILTRGKKMERIMSMAPLFRIGRVKIRKEHLDFIDEWLNYDSAIKNPKDDCLDAVEIALRLAGALLPENPSLDTFITKNDSIDDWAKADRLSMDKKHKTTDIHLGDVI